jgi:hypothetical protein
MGMLDGAELPSAPLFREAYGLMACREAQNMRLSAGQSAKVQLQFDCGWYCRRNMTFLVRISSFHNRQRCMFCSTMSWYLIPESLCFGVVTYI